MSKCIEKIKFQIRQLEKEMMQHIILPLAYMFSGGKYDEKMVVLADCHHNSCPEDMLLIRHKLHKEGYHVCDYFFDVNEISALGNIVKMLRFMRLYKCAGTVIICSYFLPVAACHKKSRTKVVNIWHGCGAMKHFGYDSSEDIPKNYKGNPFANTDVMTVSGPGCVKPFESAMNYPRAKVEAIGVSITDIYHNEKYKEVCREKFSKLYPEAKGKKIVVWAPTFRQNAALARTCGEEYIDRLIGDRQINEEYYIVKSLHPNALKGNKKNENSMTTRELMICSDILISDYSSVFFEYLLLDKPIIFFAPDYMEYMAGRGVYLDYKKLPGAMILNDKAADNSNTNNDELYERLKETLISSSYDSEEYYLQRKLYNDIYMKNCDGKSTKRLMERIYGKK